MREEGTRMRKRLRMRTIIAAVVAAMLLVAPAGCAKKQADPGGVQEQATFPVTLTDDAGREVTIEKKPERIVCLAPANTEIVYALGALDRVVGVTTFDDYPPEVSSIAKVGDFMNPNLEAIAAAKPDLVLATGGVQAETIAKLEQTGAVVLAVDPQSLDGVYAAIAMVGAAIGEPAKADEVVEEMQDELEAIQSTIEEAPVRCFIEIAQEPLYTAGPGTFINDLIDAAGGENVVTQEGYVAYSLEQLLQDDPDVYLATKGSMSDPADIDKRPGYSALSSVKAKKVFVLEDNLVSRPGPRCIQGIRQIAEALHPDAF